MAERAQQQAAARTMDATSGALLATEAVLLTLVLTVTIPMAPNWKDATVWALAVSMIFLAIALGDKLPRKRRNSGLRQFEVEDLYRRPGRPAGETRLVLLATSMDMLIDGEKGVLAPKRRSLR